MFFSTGAACAGLPIDFVEQIQHTSGVAAFGDEFPGGTTGLLVGRLVHFNTFENNAAESVMIMTLMMIMIIVIIMMMTVLLLLQLRVTSSIASHSMQPKPAHGFHRILISSIYTLKQREAGSKKMLRYSLFGLGRKREQVLCKRVRCIGVGGARGGGGAPVDSFVSRRCLLLLIRGCAAEGGKGGGRGGVGSGCKEREVGGGTGE
jgi:hypothetical protein